MKSAADLGARVRAGIKRCEVVRVVRGTGWTHRGIRAGASRAWPIGAVVDDCVPPAIPHNMVSNGHCYLRLRNDSRDTMIGAVRQVRVWPHRPASASSAHCRHGGDPSLACQTEHHGRSTTAMMRFIPCLRCLEPEAGSTSTTVTVCVSVCVCTMIVLRMCTYIRSLFCVLKGHVSTPLGPLRRPL